MKGKDCVAIASDLRFGIRQGFTVATDFEVGKTNCKIWFEALRLTYKFIICRKYLKWGLTYIVDCLD